MFQKLIEDQGKKFVEGFKAKALQWFKSQDEDHNGIFDMQQVQDDIEVVSHSFGLAAPAIARLAGLALAYWQKYAPKQLLKAEAEVPAIEGGQANEIA